jgi:hypothetical protein
MTKRLARFNAGDSLIEIAKTYSAAQSTISRLTTRNVRSRRQLCRKPFDDERACFGGGLPQRLNRLISRRILPCFRLFGAVKGNNYEVLRRVASTASILPSRTRKWPPKAQAPWNLLSILPKVAGSEMTGSATKYAVGTFVCCACIAVPGASPIATPVNSVSASLYWIFMISPYDRG